MVNADTRMRNKARLSRTIVRAPVDRRSVSHSSGRPYGRGAAALPNNTARPSPRTPGTTAIADRRDPDPAQRPGSGTPSLASHPDALPGSFVRPVPETVACVCLLSRDGCAQTAIAPSPASPSRRTGTHSPVPTTHGRRCLTRLRAAALALRIAAPVCLRLTGEPPQPSCLTHRHRLPAPLDRLA